MKNISLFPVVCTSLKFVFQNQDETEDQVDFNWHKEVGSADKSKQKEREKFYSKIGKEKQNLKEKHQGKNHVFDDRLLSIQLAEFFGEPTNEWSMKNHKQTFKVLNRITQQYPQYNVDNPRDFKGKKFVLNEDNTLKITEVSLEKKKSSGTKEKTNEIQITTKETKKLKEEKARIAEEKKKLEDLKKETEKARKELETEKKKLESEKEKLAQAKQAAEQQKKDASTEIQKVEQERKTLEAERKKNQQEQEKIEAEKQKLAQEKQATEQERKTLEAERKKNQQEQEKTEAEKQKKLEAEKEKLAQAKQAAEQEKKRLEAERKKNQQEQEKIEVEKQKTEQQKQEKEESSNMTSGNEEYIPENQTYSEKPTLNIDIQPESLKMSVLRTLHTIDQSNMSLEEKDEVKKMLDKFLNDPSNDEFLKIHEANKIVEFVEDREILRKTLKKVKIETKILAPTSSNTLEELKSNKKYCQRYIKEFEDFLFKFDLILDEYEGYRGFVNDSIKSLEENMQVLESEIEKRKTI